MEREHYSKQFDTELNEIRQKLLEMGGKVEVMINSSLKALVERDSDLAERVIASDHEINRLEMLIDEKCLEVLALRQPGGFSIWDTEEGQCLFSTNGPRRAFCFASRNPHLVIEEDDGQVTILTLPSLEMRCQLHLASSNSARGPRRRSINSPHLALAICPCALLRRRTHFPTMRKNSARPKTGR